MEREALLDILEEVILNEGDKPIEEGQTGTHFYIIKTGAVAISKDGAEIARLGAGSYFGERALLTEEPTAATVTAVERSEVMKLGKAAFDETLGPLEELLQAAMKRREKEQERQSARDGMAWDDLEQHRILGEGSFGRVRLVVHKASNQTYALKGLYKGQIIQFQQVEHVLAEKRIMYQCHHPFVLGVVATFNRDEEVHMMLELALGGELFTRLRAVGKFDEPTSKLYSAIVASAFAYLHARKIAHRDLKPENLMFGADGYVKLVDFGFAKVIEDRTYTLCGTPEYLAPEVISNKGHNVGVDWWTLGILNYEMLHSEPPFIANDMMDTYQKIRMGSYKIPAVFSSSAKDFTRQLICPNPAMRLGSSTRGAKDVLKHAYFKGIKWKELEAKEVTMPFVPEITNPLDTSNFDEVPDDGTDPADEWREFIDPELESTWTAEFGPLGV